MVGPNEKIQRSILAIQNKLTDNLVSTIGTRSTKSFLITLKQDKYQNRAYTIENYVPFDVIVNYPGNEIPVSLMGTNENATSTQTLHLYNILAITAFVKFSDNVKKGNVFLQKIKMGDGSFSVLSLEFIDLVIKANRVGVVYAEWTVAPVTNAALLNLPIFQKLINDFKEQDNW